MKNQTNQSEATTLSNKVIQTNFREEDIPGFDPLCPECRSGFTGIPPTCPSCRSGFTGGKIADYVGVFSEKI